MGSQIVLTAAVFVGRLMPFSSFDRTSYAADLIRGARAQSGDRVATRLGRLACFKERHGNE